MSLQKERIQNLIRRPGMTQEEFAKSIDYDPASFSRALNGTITEKALRRIAEGLRMPVERLKNVLNSREEVMEPRPVRTALIDKDRLLDNMDQCTKTIHSQQQTIQMQQEQIGKLIDKVLNATSEKA